MSEKSSSALTGTPTKLFEEAKAPSGSDFGTLASTPPKTPTNEPSDSPPPRFMMPGYEILAEIGRGGMGVVYKARQAGLDRLVAIKTILHADHASKDDLNRFRMEAETVARIQHPNILQIFEIGANDGAPYFSLEYCPRGSLSHCLDGTPLPARDAATLTEKLAHAVHAAHEARIIHRDLKPSNVLFTQDGEPKLADFGLAKWLDLPGATQTGAVMGTPSYMAPEQALGKKDVGPGVDIYALGAILYQLLTGRPPFKAATSIETIQQVIGEEPAPPRQLNSRIPADLETICRKSLNKDPLKRYSTAQVLADDLRRFLDGKPILARPTGSVERLVKWVRRRPTFAALIGVVIAASFLIASLGIWSYHKLRVAAERLDERYRFARQILNEAYTEAAEEILVDEPKSDPVRRAFLEKVLRFYDEFARDSNDDPVVRRETALAHFRLDQIRRALGDYPKAKADFDQAVAIQEKLLADDPESVDFRRELANTLSWRGELTRESSQDLKKAEADYSRAAQIQSALADAAPREAGVRKELSRSLYNLGIVAMDTDRADEALEKFNRAVGILDAVNEASPDSAATLHELARSHVNRGILHKDHQRFLEAEADYRRGIELFTRLKKLAGPRAVYKFEVAVAKQNLGNLHWLCGRVKEAESELQPARDLIHALVEDFPTRVGYRKKLANTLNSLGSVQAALGKEVDAEKSWLHAVDILRNLVGESASKLDYQKHLGLALGNLGWLRLKLWIDRPEKADFGAARAALKEAVQLLRLNLDANPKNPELRPALRNQYRNLAEAALLRKEPLVALDAAQALADLSSDSPQDAYYAACFAARAAPLVMNVEGMPGKGDVDRCVQAAIDFLRAAIADGTTKFERLPTEAIVFRPLERHPEFSNLRLKLDSIMPPKAAP